jgi:hypothetical protein
LPNFPNRLIINNIIDVSLSLNLPQLMQLRCLISQRLIGDNLLWRLFKA